MLTRARTVLHAWPRLSALVAGVASATGFAPLGLWPVTLIALALLISLIAQSPTLRRSAMLGWVFGIGHFTLGNNWIATAFTYQAAMPAWLGWVAVVLLALYLAIYPALATGAAWWAAQRLGGTRRAPLILLFAASWIITEWLRSWVFTGFAWNPLSAITVGGGYLPLSVATPYVTFLGTYGLSGLIILAAGWLSDTAARIRESRFREVEAGLKDSWKDGFSFSLKEPEGFWLAAVTLLMVSIPVGLLGMTFFEMSHSRGNMRGSGTPITIVQPNIAQGDKWDMAQRAINFAKLAALSPRRDASPARLLLWPEAAVPDYLESGYPLDWYADSPAFVRARLAGLLGPRDLLLTGAVKLVVGRVSLSNSRQPLLTPALAEGQQEVLAARNSVFVIDARGRLGPRYDKAHLVPYGEYLPMRALLAPLGLTRLAPGALDFWPGPGARTLDLRAQGFGQVGIQICYEMIFSGQVVDRAHRPDFIYNPSNDAWFGAAGPPQHLAQARLRAIEEGLPVVRATPTGISAIIDADGRIIESIPQHTAGRIDALVPAAHPPTVFARYGNILPLLFSVFLTLVGVAIGGRSR